MIRFTDMTIEECEGYFPAVVSLMRDEDGVFEWMIKSSATVISTNLLGDVGITCNYVLHFWSNGEVVIMSTDHPTVVDVPDDDLRELRKWVEDRGWKTLKVHHLLLEDQQGFQFWMRMYIAGLVYADGLAEHEKNEIDRLSQSAQFEEDEDADKSSFNI